MDLQEKVKRVQEFRLIDDVFFEVFAEDILELYIIYISEFDFLKGGLTTYHIDKVIRENGEIVDDGLHEIFVNTAVDDGSSTAGLMSCFTRKEVTNREFPAVTRRFQELKSEGGAGAVCEIMERYLKEAEKNGEKAGEKAERIKAIQNMIDLEIPKEKILKKYSPEEYQEAEALLMATV